jgi:hypothetical protein
VLLAALGGMRRGELLALTRRDIDLLHRTVRISTSLSSASCQWVVSACQHSLGSSAWKRRQELLGRFWGCGAMKPRRARTRQIVATDGTAARARPRRRRSSWTWIVCGPASNPSSARPLRTATISSSTTAGSLVGDDLGRFERGLSPTSPCSR